MKKQIIIYSGIILLVLINSLSYGQIMSFSGGIAGGLSTGAVKLGNLDTAFAGTIDGRNIKGFEAGVYAKGALGPFFVRPELLYNYSHGHVTSQSRGSGETVSVPVSSKYEVHRLQVPVLFGFQFLGPLYVEAGPVYSYIVNFTETYGGNSVDLGRNGLGYRVGAGLDFGPVLLNLSYSGITYNADGLRHATFTEPSRVTFGAAIRLGEIAK